MVIGFALIVDMCLEKHNDLICGACAYAEYVHDIVYSFDCDVYILIVFVCIYFVMVRNLASNIIHVYTSS